MPQAPCEELHKSVGQGYRLETVGRACSLLKAFANEHEILTLAEISVRTGLEKTIAFRLVHTLEEEGFLRAVSNRRYCLNIRVLDRKRFRIGYASQSGKLPFSDAVTESLRWATTRNMVDLVLADNQYSAKAAVRNAERLISERVDLAIEFQTYAKIAPAISSLFHAARIPLIAIEIPHPGATFFGIDNYRVGMTAGRALARAAKQIWQGQFDELLLLEVGIAGSLPHLRLTGAAVAIREEAPFSGRIHGLDTRGEFLRSFDVVRKHLHSTPKRRTLVVGVNDSAVLGALRAFEETGRANLCLGVGLGAIPEAREELRRRSTRLIGSVAFFPENYGESLVQLALEILHKRSVPPAVYASIQMITARNVDRFYPNDKLRANFERCEIGDGPLLPSGTPN
jgi:ribose transport system substrate-binding protein